MARGLFHLLEMIHPHAQPHPVSRENLVSAALAVIDESFVRRLLYPLAEEEMADAVSGAACWRAGVRCLRQQPNLTSCATNHSCLPARSRSVTALT